MSLVPPGVAALPATVGCVCISTRAHMEFVPYRAVIGQSGRLWDLPPDANLALSARLGRQDLVGKLWAASFGRQALGLVFAPNSVAVRFSQLLFLEVWGLIKFALLPWLF